MNGIQDLQALFAFSVTPGRALANLAAALLCGFLVSLFYRHTVRRTSSARSFIGALVSLAMITALVIMVIENNLARAFGLVGAMSIIRFRTAVKDVQDIVFIFFSLAVGMAAGVGLTAIAFIGTFAVGLVALAFARTGGRINAQPEYLLQFSYDPATGGEAPYRTVLEQHCRRHDLVNVRSYEPESRLELSFYVRLDDPDRSDEFVRQLGGIEGVGEINLFFDEEYA